MKITEKTIILDHTGLLFFPTVLLHLSCVIAKTLPAHQPHSVQQLNSFGLLAKSKLIMGSSGSTLYPNTNHVTKNICTYHDCTLFQLNNATLIMSSVKSGVKYTQVMGHTSVVSSPVCGSSSWEFVPMVWYS